VSDEAVVPVRVPIEVLPGQPVVPPVRVREEIEELLRGDDSRIGEIFVLLEGGAARSPSGIRGCDVLWPVPTDVNDADENRTRQPNDARPAAGIAPCRHVVADAGGALLGIVGNWTWSANLLPCRTGTRATSGTFLGMSTRIGPIAPEHYPPKWGQIR